MANISPIFSAEINKLFTDFKLLYIWADFDFLQLLSFKSLAPLFFFCLVLLLPKFTFLFLFFLIFLILKSLQFTLKLLSLIFGFPIFSFHYCGFSRAKPLYVTDKFLFYFILDKFAVVGFFGLVLFIHYGLHLLPQFFIFFLDSVDLTLVFCFCKLNFCLISFYLVNLLVYHRNHFVDFGETLRYFVLLFTQLFYLLTNLVDLINVGS